MAKCAACGKFLKPAPAPGVATCSTCPCIFHNGCVALPEGLALPQGWTCPECNKDRRKGDNSFTPVKSICGTPASLLTCDIASSSQAEIMPSLNRESFIEMSDVQAMRRDLAEYIAEAREFRQEFHASLASLSKRMDSLEQRVEAVESREVMPESHVLATLQQTVARLKQDINDRDQETFQADLDIGHLTEEIGENIAHTVTVLAAKLGVQLETKDIVFAERVGKVDTSGSAGASTTAGSGSTAEQPRPRTRRVVVRLARRDLRDEVLRAARVRCNITTSDLGMAGPARKIYVNERLTRYNRQLFHRVREECRNQHWRYSWTKRGRIFARQSDGKQVFVLRFDADVDRVFKTATVREL